MGEMLVVALRFTVGGLVLLAKMRPAGFIPFERVPAHELGELVIIREAPGPFEGLVQLLACVRQTEILPERRAQSRDLLERQREPRLAPRHPAVFPQERPELAKVLVDGPCSAASEQPIELGLHIALGVTERRPVHFTRTWSLRGELVRNSVRHDEVAISESLHERTRAQSVRPVVGEVRLT